MIQCKALKYVKFELYIYIQVMANYDIIIFTYLKACIPDEKMIVCHIQRVGKTFKIARLVRIF